MFNRMIYSSILVMYTITAFAVVEEIPLESGFSGNVALGAAILQYENNMTKVMKLNAMNKKEHCFPPNFE